MTDKLSTLYREIEEHATEWAERRAELLERRSEWTNSQFVLYGESFPETFPNRDELARANEVIAEDEDQELLLTALAFGYIRPVLGQEGVPA